jgi:hypothetical protein
VISSNYYNTISKLLRYPPIKGITLIVQSAYTLYTRHKNTQGSGNVINQGSEALEYLDKINLSPEDINHSNLMVHRAKSVLQNIIAKSHVDMQEEKQALTEIKSPTSEIIANKFKSSVAGVNRMLSGLNDPGSWTSLSISK